jgi:hypothetical protein
VERFFDAVVRPKYEHVLTTKEQSEETEDKLLASLGIEGKGKLNLPVLPDWLQPIKLEATAKGELKGEQKSLEKAVLVSQLKPIWNAERQLL